MPRGRVPCSSCSFFKARHRRRATSRCSTPTLRVPRCLPRQAFDIHKQPASATRSHHRSGTRGAGVIKAFPPKAADAPKPWSIHAKRQPRTVPLHQQSGQDVFSRPFRHRRPVEYLSAHRCPKLRALVSPRLLPRRSGSNRPPLWLPFACRRPDGPFIDRPPPRRAGSLELNRAAPLRHGGFGSQPLHPPSADTPFAPSHPAGLDALRSA